MAACPTGTVTFLFSDVEGSTSRWEQNREEMAAALARHDVLMRAAIENQGGYVFKTVGDEFCAAFPTAPHAISAALDAQRALLSENFASVGELRVRMALHTGHTDERAGDYFGPAVNRVARLLAIGHGAQVLVSGACAELLQGAMPPDCRLLDLGMHRLKDLAQPEHVHQLIATGLPETFPPLRSLDHLSNNLPRQLTSFVGRDEEMAEIAALIEAHSLVSLVGTGGAGKTRCAIQLGAELVGGPRDGVWFVELAPISDPALVTSAIARVLSVQGSANRPLLDTLLSHLKRKGLLLIIDNCEHLIDEVRKVSAAILQGCPDVHILTTSRERLNIAGEEVYRVPSLPVPSAMQLFRDRAASADKRFALTEENEPYVAEVCRQLDGIPLAIELAAARVKVLSPQQLAQKLDERFRVLTGGDRSALPRQQTMRALIDWSYDLLADDERAIFRRLSIFAGGFTLETASAVCSDERIDELSVLDLLSSLVDKSLVQAEPAGGGMRYRLLESTRQYAHEKLREGDEETTTARAHAVAFVALAELLDLDYQTTPERAWFVQAKAEIENWQAALAWALSEQHDVLLGQRLAGALRYIWDRLGAAEGRRWVRASLSAVDDATPASVVANLYLNEAQLDATLIQYKASYAAAEQALVRYRELGDALGTARAERFAGRALVLMGQIAEGEALLSQALSSSRALGARLLTGHVLQSLADAREGSGDVSAARAFYAEALAIFQSADAERFAAVTLTNLAELEFHAGDVLTALRLAADALAAYRALTDVRTVSQTLSNMASYLVALDRYDEARTHAREALTLSRNVQFDFVLLLSLQHLAAVAAFCTDREDERTKHNPARAARLLAYVDVRLATIEALREYTEQQEYDKSLAALRKLLGEDELARLMDEGRAWNEDKAVGVAMLI